jgi:hypothetical protein
MYVSKPHYPCMGWQASILAAAERLDGSGRTFVRDRWERDAANPNAGAQQACAPWVCPLGANRREAPGLGAAV